MERSMRRAATGTSTAVAVIMLVSACHISTGTTTRPLTDDVEPPSGSTSWADAADHVGETRRVCGPLARIGHDSDDVFLNIGRDYPHPSRFTIVLWDVGGVEPIRSGTTVCAKGKIADYQGVAEIELRSPGDVEVISP